MINLITGGPGAGKTAYLLTVLLDEIKSGRPFFVHGIPELKLPHEVIKCSSPMCKFCAGLDPDGDYVQAENMQDVIASDSIVILDEAQHIYRPIKMGSEIPKNVQWLETHRHDGFDMWFITQAPKLLNTNVRAMVTRHVHLLDDVFNRKMFEWPECQDNPQSNRSNAVTGSYSLNKEVFPLYKSSSMHHKQSRKIPIFVYFTALSFLVLPIAGYYLYKSFFSRNVPESVAQASVPVQSAENPIGIISPASVVSSFDFTPRDPFRMETAPAYDKLRKVIEAPYVMACMSSEGRCECYTQQMTVYPTRYAQCLDIIEGREYNPYLVEHELTSRGLDTSLSSAL